MRRTTFALPSTLAACGVLLVLSHPAQPHAQGAAGGRIEIVAHEDQKRVDVTVDGKPFTSYIWPTTLKKPVLYPLRSAPGTVVTRGFPLDPGRASASIIHITSGSGSITAT